MLRLARCGRCQRGTATIEYALLACLVGVALAGPAEALAKRLAATAQQISESVGPPQVTFARDEDENDCEPFKPCNR